jgi:hypothetical protein
MLALADYGPNNHMLALADYGPNNHMLALADYGPNNHILSNRIACSDLQAINVLKMAPSLSPWVLL